MREGRLKAVRIGKQYRIAQEDLEAFTGQAVPASPAATVRRDRLVEVTGVVEITTMVADLLTLIRAVVEG